MITDYCRPQSMEEAFLSLTSPTARPLGGGTKISRSSDESYPVVDLQNLGLDRIQSNGIDLNIGATITLQELLESSFASAALIHSIKLEAPLNRRNIGTVAGSLIASDGRSPFAAVMLALDAKLEIQNSLAEKRYIRLGDFLPLHEVLLHGGLITSIVIPMQVKLAFEAVSRSSTDKPIISVALAYWPSKRIRIVIGGWGKSPCLGMDGDDLSSVQTASRTATHDAADEWANADYRCAVASVLAQRCLEKTTLGEE
jgi:CO/xanthine dehydrogenase FAD-binding subunit